MAAFDFPAAPLVGQAYSLNGVAFTWNGYGWVQQGNPAGVTAAYVDAQDALKVAKAGDTMSGDLTIQKLSADHARLSINANVAGGYAPMILGLVEGKYCWVTYLGKDFFIQRYNDAGAALDIPFQVYRSNGTASFNLTTPSTSPTTGALQVAGGVGVGGNVNINSDLNVVFGVAKVGPGGTGSAGGWLRLDGGSTGAGGGIVSFLKNSAFTWHVGHASIVLGTPGVDDFVFYSVVSGFQLRLSATTGQLSSSSNVPSSSPTTGALTVAGGVGVGGALNVGGEVVIGGSRVIFIDNGGITWGGAQSSAIIGNSAINYITFYTANNVAISVGPATTQFPLTTPSTSPTTGALTIAGGVGVGGALHVAGMVSLDSAIGTPQIYIVDQAAVSIPGNSSAIIAPAGGYFFLVANVSQGQNGMYIADSASQTNLVTGSNGLWVASTTTPAAGFASVAWDGTNFRIYNANAAAQFFRCCAIKIR